MMCNVFLKERLNYMAIALLEQLEITPNESHIRLVEETLSAGTVDSKMVMRNPLTLQQQLCLFWAAQGFTAKQTANVLKLEISTVVSHRKEAIRRLSCKTLTQAVCKALRIGVLALEVKDDV